MNFVVFSYSFPPRNGAETFCTARFVSAIARAGHNVHVVTMDHPKAISQEMYDFLVDRRIRITRVALVSQRRRWRSRLRYRISGNECVNFANCCKALRSILLKTEQPILVSRSMPLASNVIGWYCRKYAKKWIAHFSDPSPWDAGGAKGMWNRIWEKATVNWTRRIIRDCDAVSITCDAANRFFHEQYGDVYDSKPIFTVPHIGEPVAPIHGSWTRSGATRLVVHAGGLNFERGVRSLVCALQELNQSGEQIEFVQIGQVDQCVAEYLSEFSFVRVLNDVDPGLAMAISAQADALFIPDMKTGLPYIPFLPSKFAYQVFGNVPIVIYTMQGSPMDTYARKYPRSGVCMADMCDEGSLVKAMRQAFSINKNMIDRGKLREEFSRATVSSEFVKHVESLIRELTVAR